MSLDKILTDTRIVEIWLKLNMVWQPIINIHMYHPAHVVPRLTLR
jgi:hypothetical protein